MTPRELVAVVLITVGLAAWTAGWFLLAGIAVGLVATGAPLCGFGILIALTEGDPIEVEPPAPAEPEVRVEGGRPVLVGQ